MDAPLRLSSAPASGNGPATGAAESESLLLRRQRELLHDLTQLVRQRKQVEPQLEEQLHSATEAAEEEYDVTFQAAVVRFAADKEAVDRELEHTRQAATARYGAEGSAAEKEFVGARQRMVQEYETAQQEAKNEFQETRWTITTLFEGIKSTTEKQQKDVQLRSAAATQQMERLQAEASALLHACRQSAVLEREFSAPQPSAESDPFLRLEDCLATAEGELQHLKRLRIPRYFQGERLLWIYLLLCVVAIAVSGFLAGRSYGAIGWVYALVGCTLGVLFLSGILSWWLKRIARRQVSRHYEPFAQILAEARILLERGREQVTAEARRQLGRARRHYQRDLGEAKQKYVRQRNAIKQRRLTTWTELSTTYRQRRAEIKQRYESGLAQATTRHETLRSQIQERYDHEFRQARERHATQLADAHTAYETARHRLVTEWQEGVEHVHRTVAAIHADDAAHSREWNDPFWSNWQPKQTFPTAIRFGEFPVDPGLLPQRTSGENALPLAELGPFPLPALLSFPNRFGLLVTAQDQGRLQGVELLQTIMFRLVTTLPAGKVRFTILDPVGLGQNFASFMHLADYDEALVTSRIWTEQAHIEQRLADLTGHMENVIQKYLRNQFETLEEYNAHAGEVAEPYRILVVANFPVHFSVEAARRLVSILQSGPRCGVYTLLSVDAQQALPQGFNSKDLQQPGVNLLWKGERFRWLDADFGSFPLRLDPAPPAELCNRILQIIGEKAREAKRVEVPFEFVAPPPEQWWTANSREGLSVPLGRVGATGRQHLKLGQGTAQHVLIAGKTGSGKSTLLHALISNLALSYSPDEVELYLVDFKKGVEFKTYATHALPHARVIAVESEREFGLSVLQRLDAELKVRGDQFRERGAQNLSAYRQANGARPTPRILLIVDEFQEFFVEDDRIAQEAALLLDRLVRQGRAFGLHVLLGSQTLGGAYTLARSTIDQMAVRIALQCSDADGHIILSDDNSAARLLSRPGEAIYNDANGLVEGNNPFQVVWLEDERREEYLRQIQEMARHSRVESREQIVFEGNVPSDISKNPLLRQRLLEPAWPEQPPSEAVAWLGEAVAIKDPTAAAFRTQNGTNLLIIGQHGEAARGILATALVGLAAQYPPTTAGFYLLDGSPEDVPEAGYLAALSAVLPQPLRTVGWRDLAAVLGELAEEVERRQQTATREAATLYLLVYGLQRFRDLRKQEDDFGFSRREEKPNPAKLFATILREGPAVGVHALVWCDSLNNLNRTFDRQTLREFELRVLFQMSATDSSNLIDSPLASKLGMHRALFHSEEQGKLEKFRPYGLPTRSWLEWVKEQLRKKVQTSSPVLPAACGITK